LAAEMSRRRIYKELLITILFHQIIVDKDAEINRITWEPMVVSSLEGRAQADRPLAWGKVALAV